LSLLFFAAIGFWNTPETQRGAPGKGVWSGVKRTFIVNQRDKGKKQADDRIREVRDKLGVRKKGTWREEMGVKLACDCLWTKKVLLTEREEGVSGSLDVGASRKRGEWYTNL